MLLSHDKTIAWACKATGICADQAKRLKQLEKENARLKRSFADAELGKAILKEATTRNF